jgi:hypothetical protein
VTLINEIETSDKKRIGKARPEDTKGISIRPREVAQQVFASSEQTDLVRRQRGLNDQKGMWNNDIHVDSP